MAGIAAIGVDDEQDVSCGATNAYDHVAPDVLWKLAQEDLAEIEKVCREELVAAEARERP
jgi:hypothetical protein